MPQPPTISPSRAIEAQHCSRIPWLRAHGVAETATDDLTTLVAAWGATHEQNVLASFPTCTDLSRFDWSERIARTRDALARHDVVIYQPAFAEEHPGGFIIRGSPDFLIREGAGYVIRDCKLARRDTEDRKDFLLQLQIYGWMLERVTGVAPVRLEIHGGNNEIADMGAYDPAPALDAMQRAHEYALLAEEPHEPVGWSKCGGCAFHDHCWPRAVEHGETGLVAELDQGMARSLHAMNVNTIDDVLKRFARPEDLAPVQKPHGTKTQRIGDLRAYRILRNARALHTNTAIPIAPPALIRTANAVMFDLEGFPPIVDGTDNIYLWGTKVFGKKPSPFIVALTDFTPQGERHAWEQFLNNAATIFKTYGADIPFIHWATYERTHVTRCIAAHGDPDGIGARVLKNLLDLLPIVKASVALPVYSYSLKVVEKYLGFARTQTEYGGAWSMVQYVRAAETDDAALRAEVMQQIATYNEEDLDATAAVWEWVRGLG